jgi:lactoylglutathione lyase
MCNVTGFFHTGVTVSEMPRSVGFYRDGLGLEFDWEKHGATDETRELIALDFESLHNVFLKLPGGGSVELIEYAGIDRQPATLRPCDPGAAHLCLYVDDIDSAVERGRRFGGVTRSTGPVAIKTGPAAGCKIVYLADPDGFIIELFERPAEAAH